MPHWRIGTFSMHPDAPRVRKYQPHFKRPGLEVRLNLDIQVPRCVGLGDYFNCKRRGTQVVVAMLLVVMVNTQVGLKESLFADAVPGLNADLTQRCHRSALEQYLNVPIEHLCKGKR